MPYVSPDAQMRLLDPGEIPVTPGELTYQLTAIMLRFGPNAFELDIRSAMRAEIDRYMEQLPDVRFEHLCGVIGALTCTWMEYKRRRPSEWMIAYNVCCRVADDFYRKVVAPYEDRKILENGDVYK